ncbi:UNVERIFIED_CONTAM: hypothetical protein FKN15_055665 [Acipenser sinensis]
MVLRYLAEDMAEIPAFQVPQWVELPSCEPEQVQLLSTEPEGEEPTLQSPELEEEEPPSPELEGEELQAYPPDFGGGRRAGQPSIAVGGAGSLSPAVGGAGSTTRTARGFLYCITWGSFVVDLWGVAGASLEVASLFTAAATPATPVAPPKDACLASPKDACLAPPKDARAAPLRDTTSESPGVACCSTSPWEPPVAEYKGEVELPLPPSGPGAPLPSSPPEGPQPPSPPEGPLPPSPPEGLLLPSRPEGPASPGVTASPEWQQEVLWPEPHKGELPAMKKGGEVRRPLPTQPRPPPLCHSSAPGGWIPWPGIPDTQAPCLELWLLGLTARSQHHQAQEVAWSPAPLPLVAQTSLHSRLGSHLCLGLQPTGRLPALPTPHPMHLGPLSPGLGPAKRAPGYGLTLPQQWEKEDLPPWPPPWTTCFPSSETLGLRGEVAIGAKCAVHKWGDM